MIDGTHIFDDEFSEKDEEALDEDNGEPYVQREATKYEEFWSDPCWQMP